MIKYRRVYDTGVSTSFARESLQRANQFLRQRGRKGAQIVNHRISVAVVAIILQGPPACSSETAQEAVEAPSTDAGTDTTTDAQVDAASDATDVGPGVDGPVAVSDAADDSEGNGEAEVGEGGEDVASDAVGCPPVTCDLHCAGGFNIDAAGCEICECRYDTVLTWIEDVSTPAYGTFSSHNQRVVETPHGIFMTFQVNEKDAEHNGDWKLVRSQNRGASWTQVYSDLGTRPPAVLADNEGNVHLVTSDPDFETLHIYSFSASTGYGLAAHHTYAGVRCAAKFTALYDPTWNNVYVGTQFGRFLAIWLQTYGIMHDYQVFEDQPNHSPHATAQYPQLGLDDAGNIHFAMTTSNLTDTHVYRNILHVFASPLPNGQLMWSRIPRPGESGAQGVPTPIQPDENGDALEINDSDERGQPSVVSVHLSNFMPKGNMVHFFYTVVREGVPDWRTHYKRINRWTGAVEVDLDGDTTPIAGESIVLRPYGGFFSTDSIVDPNTPLYLTSGERDRGQIGVLVSHDNGSTWGDYAVTDVGPMSWSNISGSQYSNGRILAAFTGAPANPGWPSSVWYLGFYPK